MTDSPDDLPDFATLAADPEIAALLDFEPVERQLKKANGWSAGMQRMFIAWLAHYGSPGKAADELGKARSGVDKLYKAADADSFRAAWDGAVALAEQRLMDRLATAQSGAGAMKAPSISRGKPESSSPGVGSRRDPPPGMGLNEYGEWEDLASLDRRAQDARDSIARKLLRARRLYLQEISPFPGKRAAFEMLSEYSIDWDKAARLEVQPDEPWKVPRMREPDMLLVVENGWLGDIAHGRDKIAELRIAIDLYRVEQGLPAIDWNAEDDDEE